MSEHATEIRGLRRGKQADPRRRGTALFGTLVVCLGLMGLLYTTVVVSAVEVEESRITVDDVRVKYLAEAGVERGMHFISSAIDKANAANPLENLEALFAGGATTSPFVGEVATYNGSAQGAYTVSIVQEAQTATSMTLRLDVTGYLPTAPNLLAPGQRVEAWEAVSVIVELQLAPSRVFDYAYFINNWGWFYGNTINAVGNVRSNGQFDAGGYSPTITGQPTYDSLEYSGGIATLTGYKDDNEDGLADGNDGGVFSGWDLVNAANIGGNGGLAQNQHEFEDQLPMPNLSDLGMYENMATSAGGGISIGGSKVSDAVYGDDPGERKNLYLIGTAADPIELNGPVVVQGDVIIGGYVTGQGAIFSQGNVYVPDSIFYVDGPTTKRPVDNTQAATEKWIQDNWDKDFLGLFAAENVVVGDHTDPTWEHYVSGWLGSNLNKSAEDAGEDGIPNTIDGRDGIAGTADDDVLEDDNVWTVEYYSQSDEDLGLIPPGSKVGDVVPGSGEDIDGDGQYDDTLTTADFAIGDHLNTGLWGGNMPVSGIHDYSTIATLYANNLDATFYTNHAYAHLVLGSDPAVMNGAVVSRNESIVYGTPSFTINYDCRLLGGAGGFAGDFLPQIIAEPVIVRWIELDNDPNFYIQAQAQAQGQSPAQGQGQGKGNA